MKSFLTAGLLVAGFIVVGGCTGSERERMISYKSGEVTCYSGGKVIYHGISIGYVNNERESHGYYFLEKGTGKLIRVSGQCVVRQTS